MAVLQAIAHVTSIPHEEPHSPSISANGDPSSLVILLVVVLTLVALGMLLWLRERQRREDRSGRSEPDQHG